MSKSTEKLYEVLAGASAGGTSINHVCETTDDSPHANTVRRYLTDQFELDSVESVGDTLSNEMLLRHRRIDRWRSSPTSTPIPTTAIKRDRGAVLLAGETWNHDVSHLRYALRAGTNKRFTLAVRRLVAGDTTGDVLAEFLELLDGLDLSVKIVYLGRRFYNSTCLTLLYAHNYAYVMPIGKWDKTIQDELSRGWSREIEHDLAGKVTFSVSIDCVYQQGRYDKHGVARHGYAADAPFIDTPREARYHYAKRFGIEASYRLSEQSIATTTTQNPVARLLYVVVSLLLQNVWRYLHLEYVATPHRGGRRLWKWPFTEFIKMVCRTAWTALAMRRAVPANRPPDDRFSR